MSPSSSASDPEPQRRAEPLRSSDGAGARDAAEAAEAKAERPASDRDHGTLQPQPRRRLDRRLDGESSDPDGSHVCAPTDA